MHFMLIVNRRKFLQVGSLASASAFVPKFLKAFEKQVPPASQSKILIVIQLSGGNDGLNTVIPYRNDVYYKSRPKLGMNRDKVLSMNDELGLHPALSGFKNLYDEGYLSVLNEVGYPNPDRSHFRSMDIWQTASGSERVLQTGWLGRYLDAQCDGSGQHPGAIEVDDTLSLTLKGSQIRGMTVPDPSRLYASAHDPFFSKLAELHSHDIPASSDNLGYLYKTLRETTASADYIYQHSKIYSSRKAYPDTPFGKGMKTIAELIVSGCETKVYYISLGSFDTHVNQAPQQERLFKELGTTVATFAEDLREHHRFEETLLVTFSEFGRRVTENASGGTDHGTANCMFLISGHLEKPGVLNQGPDLQQLDQGDLIFKVDFRDVYASLLEKWLDTDPALILGASSHSRVSV